MMTSLLPHILIVDDDARLRELLKRYLSQNDFFVSSVTNITEARKALACFSFDAIILDIMMPGGLGTELLKKDVNPHPLPPSILLSAMGEPHDRINGLELGANDYLTKPFEPQELLLRLRNILQRKGKTLIIGDFTYCCRQRLLSKDGAPIPLTQAESNLLFHLSSHFNQTLSRQNIALSVFPKASNERIVDVQINRLRKKIELTPDKPSYLLSMRGEGYCLKAELAFSA